MSLPVACGISLQRLTCSCCAELLQIRTDLVYLDIPTCLASSYHEALRMCSRKTSTTVGRTEPTYLPVCPSVLSDPTSVISGRSRTQVGASPSSMPTVRGYPPYTRASCASHHNFGDVSGRSDIRDRYGYAAPHLHSTTRAQLAWSFYRTTSP